MNLLHILTHRAARHLAADHFLADAEEITKSVKDVASLDSRQVIDQTSRCNEANNFD